MLLAPVVKQLYNHVNIVRVGGYALVCVCVCVCVYDSRRGREIHITISMCLFPVSQAALPTIM